MIYLFQNEDSYNYDLLASGQKKLTLEEAELFSMAASKEFIESCTFNNNNFNMDEIQNNFENNHQVNDNFGEMKPDRIDEKYSESTVDSPYSSVMSESLVETTMSNAIFFPPVVLQSSNRGRGIVSCKAFYQLGSKKEVLC